MHVMATSQKIKPGSTSILVQLAPRVLTDVLGSAGSGLLVSFPSEFALIASVVFRTHVVRAGTQTLAEA